MADNINIQDAVEKALKNLNRENSDTYGHLQRFANTQGGWDPTTSEVAYKNLKKQADEAERKLKYDRATLDVVIKMREEDVEALKRANERLDAEKAVLEEKQKEHLSDTEAAKIAQELLNIEEERKKNNDAIGESTAKILKNEAELNRAFTENVSLLEKKSAYQNRLNHAKEVEKKLMEEARKRIAAGENKDTVMAETRNTIQATFAEMGLSKGGNLNLKDSFSAGLSEALNEGSVSKGISTIFSSALGDKFSKIIAVLNGINKVVGTINQSLDKGIQDALSVQSTYLSKVNSRLQGSEESFQSIQEYLSTNFKDSPFLSQKKTLENIASLIETGTAENVKERGILMTLSDRMVTTFNALDTTLLRLNRLQQSDMTASQLGYESLLTNFFNEQFGDTSYLSDLYDNVTDTILDATSQLDSQTAGAFNFAVQKWLGSLYALGMSSQGINTIAQGLNYIATGNVEAFNSNEGLRNLFAGASGSAFSGILTGGLNAETVDSLMMSIIEYLKEIAGDTNTVTRQARAGIFGGFSMSDIRSIQNLTATQLSSIYNTQKTYDDSRRELHNQLINSATMYSDSNGTNARVPLSVVFDNMIENALYTFGVERMSDAGAYGEWRINSLIANSGIPGLNALANVANFLNALIGKNGSPFLSLASSLIDMGSTAVTNNWDGKLREFMGTGAIQNIFLAEAPKRRGNADDFYSIAASNTFTGLSASEVFNASADQSLDLAATAAATSAKTTYAGGETTRDITDLYSELFERQTTAIKVSLYDVDSIAANAIGTIIKNNSGRSTQITSISDNTLTALGECLNSSAVKTIADKVTGTIDVNMNSNLVEELNQGLAWVRSL